MLIRATYAGVGAIYHQVNRDDIYVFILLTIKVIIFSRLYWHSTIQPTGSTQCSLSFVAPPSSSVEDQLTISQIITRPTILDRQNVATEETILNRPRSEDENSSISRKFADSKTHLLPDFMNF